MGINDLYLDDPPEEWGYYSPHVCYYPGLRSQITFLMQIVKDNVSYEVWDSLCASSDYYIWPESDYKGYD